jgi:hypothetical protein
MNSYARTKLYLLFSILCLVLVILGALKTGTFLLLFFVSERNPL